MDANRKELFWDLVRSRRSIRAFQDLEVSDEVIKKILSAAFFAPRGSQEKNWDFIIIKNKNYMLKLEQIIEKKVEELAKKIEAERLKKVFTAYSAFFKFFTKSPAVIVVVEKAFASILVKILKPIETAEYMENITIVGKQNVSAAIQNVVLACEAEGVGACWMTGILLAQNELREELGLKSDEKVAAFIPIGYPKSTVPPHKFPEEKDLNFRVI